MRKRYEITMCHSVDMLQNFSYHLEVMPNFKHIAVTTQFPFKRANHIINFYEELNLVKTSKRAAFLKSVKTVFMFLYWRVEKGGGGGSPGNQLTRNDPRRSLLHILSLLYY